jgi:hypothetical protein
MTFYMKVYGRAESHNKTLGVMISDSEFIVLAAPLRIFTYTQCIRPQSHLNEQLTSLMEYGLCGKYSWTFIAQRGHLYKTLHQTAEH